jgi:hypothetical protein
MGVSGQRHAPATLYPRRKDPRYPLYRRLGGPQSPFWTRRLEEKSSCLCRGSNFDSPVVQSVVRHYTAWANTAPQGISVHSKYVCMYNYLILIMFNIYRRKSLKNNSSLLWQRPSTLPAILWRESSLGTNEMFSINHSGSLKWTLLITILIIQVERIKIKQKCCRYPRILLAKCL